MTQQTLLPSTLASSLKKALIKLGYAHAGTSEAYVQDIYHKYVQANQIDYNPLLPYAVEYLPPPIKSILTSTEGGNAPIFIDPVFSCDIASHRVAVYHAFSSEYPPINGSTMPPIMENAYNGAYMIINGVRKPWTKIQEFEDVEIGNSSGWVPSPVYSVPEGFQLIAFATITNKTEKALHVTIGCDETKTDDLYYMKVTGNNSVTDLREGKKIKQSFCLAPKSYVPPEVPVPNPGGSGDGTKLATSGFILSQNRAVGQAQFMGLDALNITTQLAYDYMDNVGLSEEEQQQMFQPVDYATKYPMASYDASIGFANGVNTIAFAAGTPTVTSFEGPSGTVNLSGKSVHTLFNISYNEEMLAFIQALMGNDEITEKKVWIVKDDNTIIGWADMASDFGVVTEFTMSVTLDKVYLPVTTAGVEFNLTLRVADGSGFMDIGVPAPVYRVRSSHANP